MYLEGALAPEAPGPVPDRLFFVFLIPCLNEELVVRATLDRLASLPTRNFLALVIDDGSTDHTYDIAHGHPDDRIHILRRVHPDARQGKGVALNAAITHLRESDLLTSHAAGDVVVVLLDADGRLDPEALFVVGGYFRDPTVGAVQVAVRIHNRRTGLLALLQDMEFVVSMTIFQRARNRLGNAGLGGNGQFTRLSALLTLGPDPWSPVLTEDLDLGVRMQLRGWKTLYCPTVSVHQQGLTRLARLVRQRSRWFQGHLQSWRLVPQVVRDCAGRRAAETLHVLLMPYLVIVSSFMSLSFVVTMCGVAFSPLAQAQLFQQGPVLSWYALTFLPGVFLGYVYRRHGDRTGLVRTFLYGHALVLYGIVWMLAGWWALGRIALRRRTWLKTDREVEPLAEERRHDRVSDYPRSA
jgi:cellulose synthase/poly-beta-1,6-N-acetylglucosamine synthase-like glycosyltransferase